MEILGVRILGLNTETLWKVLLSLGVLGVVFAVRALLHVVTGFGSGVSRRTIWTRKATRIAFGAVGALVLLSIWFDSPARLATFSGLILAGAAFASQNAVLSIAGYFVIVFGKTFDLGDRIQIGEVRGDVLDVGLFKTTIMEMGIPPPVAAEPNTWITARQYTGRVVTVTNAEIFKQPTYNYTRNFHFLWEEMRVPVHYDVDLRVAESILLAAVREVTAEVRRDGQAALNEMRERYLIHAGDLEPRTYVRLTDNWVELSVRFLVKAFGVREVKDQISRRVLQDFRTAGIEIASTTIEVVRMVESGSSRPGGAGDAGSPGRGPGY